MATTKKTGSKPKKKETFRDSLNVHDHPSYVDRWTSDGSGITIIRMPDGSKPKKK